MAELMFWIACYITGIAMIQEWIANYWTLGNIVTLFVMDLTKNTTHPSSTTKTFQKKRKLTNDHFCICNSYAGNRWQSVGYDND